MCRDTYQMFHIYRLSTEKSLPTGDDYKQRDVTMVTWQWVLYNLYLNSLLINKILIQFTTDKLTPFKIYDYNKATCLKPSPILDLSTDRPADGTY